MATVVALTTRWLRIPYVVGLVLAGLVIPKESLPETVGLNPDVVLNLFLPILIFEAAINTDISRLRSTLKPVALLAGPGCSVISDYDGSAQILVGFGLDHDWAKFGGIQRDRCLDCWAGDWSSRLSKNL